MIRMEEGGDRMRVTLLDQMSTVENARSSVTLEDILMSEMTTSRPQQQPSPARNNHHHHHHHHRILLDVIRTDRRRNKTTWKSLRDKLRLKRTSTTPSNSDRHRLGFLLSISETEEAVEREERMRRIGNEEREPARMSLMELLEDEDGPMFEVASTEEEAERRDETVAVDLGSCCVCMVRSKGAAFIPCGHTFCRLCSRELWVQRGNCPLCNTSILQILDLF